MKKELIYSFKWPCLILLASFAPFLLACLKNSPPKEFVLPLPNKDVIATIDGQPFTISDFLRIRSQLKDPSAETTYWIGIGSFALKKEADRTGRTLSLYQAVQISKYSLGETSTAEIDPVIRQFFPDQSQLPSPQQIKNQINQLIKESLIQKGLTPISSI